MSDDPLDGRCGTCARFVRVSEVIDNNGEVRRRGECLLGVWPAPLYADNTCSQYVRKGTFTAKPARRERSAPARRRDTTAEERALPREPITIPEELLDMDADEFRRVLREVIRDELGISEVALGARWKGGEVVLKPGRDGTADKTVPIETFFHKIVMIRDKLRVLEQKINGSARLDDEEKVQMQQYVTQCYGSLTSFNVLFADKDDGFVGHKGDD